MHFIEPELNRIQDEILKKLESGSNEGMDSLRAAQQALAWASEPRCYKSPYDLVMGTETRGAMTDANPA